MIIGRLPMALRPDINMVITILVLNMQLRGKKAWKPLINEVFCNVVHSCSLFLLTSSITIWFSCNNSATENKEMTDYVNLYLKMSDNY